MQLTTVSVPGKEIIIKSERDRIVRSIFEMAYSLKNYYVINSFNEGMTIEVTKNRLYESWKNKCVINLKLVENRNTVRLILHIKKAATFGLKQRDFHELQNELEVFYSNLLGYLHKDKYEANKAVATTVRKHRFSRRKVAAAFLVYLIVMIYLFYIIIKNVFFQ